MGKELKVKGQMDLEKVASYLDELAAGLMAGTVSVSKGAEYVVLKPSAPVWVEVEAELGKSKETLSLEISWAIQGEATAAEELVISSEPPVVEFGEEPVEEALEEAVEDLAYQQSSDKE